MLLKPMLHFIAVFTEWNIYKNLIKANENSGTHAMYIIFPAMAF